MNKTFDAAMRLLARREHGAQELVTKLARKGHKDRDVQEALLKCQELDLQNDARFIENFSRMRIRQGYGPVKIRQELQNLGIAREFIDQFLEQEKDNWPNYALEVWKKKYKSQDKASYAVLQKQKQFLLYRGFSMETIASLFEKDGVLQNLQQA